MQAPFSSLDHQSLRSLVDDYGESFYLFRPSVLKHNLESFREAFSCHWPRTKLGYSYKTNYMPFLCRLLDEWGCSPEVVSGMEYEVAKAIGANPDKIVFNGPYKQFHEIERALLDGALVNVDSVYELELIREISERNEDRVLRVGLRAGFQVGNASTRFGLDITNGDMDRAVEKLLDMANVRVVCLHTHLIPPGRTAQGYETMMRTLIALYHRYAERLPIECLDLGGGFFSNMPKEMAAQFTSQRPTFEEYGAAIGGAMREAFDPENGPELMLEPGMALVADAMQFVARVVDIKNICGRAVALLAGSVFNIRPSKSLRNLPLRRIAGTRQAERFDAIDLVGYTCMQDDILHRDYTGPLAVDDFVEFANCGAYTLVLKPPFIRPNVPILALQEDGDIAVAKRAESFEDVFQTYQAAQQF